MTTKAQTKLGKKYENMENVKIVDCITNQDREKNINDINDAFDYGAKIVIAELPPKIQPGSFADFKLKTWQEFYLTKQWVDKAEKDGIPYPTEWFMISEIYKDENGNPTSARIVGSCGGAYDKIPWNQGGIVESANEPTF